MTLTWALLLASLSNAGAFSGLFPPSMASLGAAWASQARVLGKMSDLDSIAVRVNYDATGGKITSGGLYTAGPGAGTFRVVAVDPITRLADTTAVTVAAITVAAGARSATMSQGGGIPFGPFHLPAADFGTPYTGALQAVSVSNVISYLDAVRAAKARVVISLPGARPRYTNPSGTWNFELWKQRVDPYRGIDFAPYVADGTIIANYLLDEPQCAECWGGRPVPREDIEAAAKYSKTLWPTMPTTVRATPSWLSEANFQWVYLDAAWVQYRPRWGPVRSYLAGQVETAKRLGLGLVVGLNTWMGNSDRTPLTAEQIISNGAVLAAEPYACAFISWRYEPTYDGRSDIRDAMTSVAKIAGDRPTTSCVQH
jgi:hypothetical protein